MEKQDDTQQPSLEDLQQRIDEAKGGPDSSEQKEENNGSINPFRIGIELFAGVAVGMFLGYHMDKWLETKPWFFLLFFFFGILGGSLNIYRLMRDN